MINGHPYLDDQKRKQLKEFIQRLNREHSVQKVQNQLLHEVQKLISIDSKLEDVEAPIGYNNIEGITTIAAILNMDFPDSLFLIDNLILAESLNILGGSSDGGKSTLIFQLCISICCKNESFLGCKINSKYNSVIYVSTEDNQRQIKSRLDKQLSDNSTDKKIFNYFGVVDSPVDAILKIAKGLSQQPADLVVIDNLLDLFTGDSNSATEARIFMNRLQELINKYHCTILMVHHTGKATERNQTKTSLLGSQAFEAKPRQALILKQVAGYFDRRKLEVVKGNFVDDSTKKEGILLHFDAVTLTFSRVEQKIAEPEMQHRPMYDVKPDKVEMRYNVRPDRPPKQRKTHKQLQREAKMMRAYEMNYEGKTLEQIAEVFSVDKSTVCRWLKKMKI